MLMQWVDFQGRSSYQTEAKLSEPIGLPAVIYVIEVRQEKGFFPPCSRLCFAHGDTCFLDGAIQHLTGRVRQHDALSGNRNWVFDCVTLTGIASCQDSVEAEFRYVLNG